MAEQELCALCDWTLPGGRKEATTHCLKCGKPICAWHGYPKYEGEIKTENFIGRICYLCLSEPASKVE